MESHGDLQFSGFNRRQLEARVNMENALPRYFLRPALVYEIKEKLANVFRRNFFRRACIPRHALFTLVAKQFLDFASLKNPRHFKRGILCRTFFGEKQNTRMRVH